MMRKVKISDLYQYYSHAGKEGHTPNTELWVVNVTDSASDLNRDTVWLSVQSDGIKLNTIEEIEGISHGWVGWCFYFSEYDNNNACAALLFEDEEDAMLAKLRYSGRELLNSV